MTICIGAIAKIGDSENLVIASDRMITQTSGTTTTEFEHQMPKIIEISSNAVILIAGDTLKGTTLTKEIKNHFNNGSIVSTKIDISEIAKLAADKYFQSRFEFLNTLLFKLRGITGDYFYKEGQKNIQPQLVSMIDNNMTNFNYGVELLLAGIYNNKAFIYNITNPGIYNEWGQIGYCSIGIGSPHATQSLIGLKQSPLTNLDNTIFSVYASKRRSEVAPGVGKDTDMLVINNEKITWISSENIAKIEIIYNDYMRPLPQEIVNKITELNLH